jgi:hypothetical protein
MLVIHMVSIKHQIIGAVSASVLAAAPAGAQADRNRFELGVQVPSAVSSEFNTTDIGLGVRVGWRPAGWLGVEAELDTYPRDFPRRGSFSGSRLEGLFGTTVGGRIGKVRPFGRLRPGFMQFRAPQPLPCIAIFPPPLVCTLGSGRTVFALDAGGGVEVSATSRTFLRVDVGDRLIKYPGPSIGNNFERRESFFSHDFRFAAGGGVRF